MQKEDLLTFITEASASRRISETEVVEAFRRGQGEIQQPVRRRLTLINILYALGGIIVVLGIFLFFQQQWASLNSTARILVTLGSGIAAYVTGIFLSRVKSFVGVAWSFFLIFALLVPFGLYITLTTYHFSSPIISYENAIYSIMFVWMLASFLVLRFSIFRIFTIIFGSLFYFSLTGAILERNPAIQVRTAFEYRFLVLGISYFLMGYGWKLSAPLLTQWMYSIGTIMFLGASLALGGYTPSANKVWEIIFIGLNFGVMFLSVYLRSRAMLLFGSLFLMIYILKITAEYFSDTLGWPISLIVAGFALIAIGFGTFMMNQRYIKKSSARPV